MKKDALENIRRFLAVLLTVVLVGSSLQPAGKVFATEGSGVESGTELETETTTNQTGEGETEAASGSALEAGETTLYFEDVYMDLDPVQTSATALSFWGLNNGVVDKTTERAVKWIDRIDTTGELAFIKTFYETLEAASDNVEADALIENNVDENGNQIDNKIVAVTVSVPVASSNDAPVTEQELMNQWSTIATSTMNQYSPFVTAAYDAFDRDHPEVFWLSGSTSVGAGYKDHSGSVESGWIFEIDIYFWIQRYAVDANGNKTDTIEFDIRATDYGTQELIEEGIKNLTDSINEIVSDEDVVGKTDYEKVKFFNQWLTTNNEYNTIVASGGTQAPKDCWECISALVGVDGSVAGRIGNNGPVYEAYAGAFKVLCDEVGIECVLVDGDASSTKGGTAGGHMWNYVQVDNNWYAVDVTWNDPTGGNSGAVSSKENEKWLLLGSSTVVSGSEENGTLLTFIDSHPVENCLRDGGVAFTNGPVLSETAYEPPVAGVAMITNGSTTTTYATFADALAAWTDGTTLTLLTNVTHDTTIEIVSTTNKTLDLNGKTLDMSGMGTKPAIQIGRQGNITSMGYNYEPGVLTICDSSNTDGTIKSNYVMCCYKSSKVSLESGNLQGYVTNSGTFNMTGGSVITPSDEREPAVSLYAEDATFNISGGTLEGRYGIWNNGIVKISGMPVIRGKDLNEYSRGNAVANVSGTMTISGNPILEGGSDGDFYITNPITFAAMPAGNSTWSVYMDDIGRFAIPADEVTLDVSMFTSKVEGCQIYEREDGLYLVKDISNAEVTLDISANPVYNGSAIAPGVASVVLNGSTLTAGTDYTVSYENNTNAGEATVIINGIGAYIGTVTKTFTIAPVALTVASVTAINKTYDGTANVAINNITLNGIINSDNVSIDCTNLTGTVSSANADTYGEVTLPALTLTGTAAGNYTLTQPVGAVNLTVAVTISPKSVTPTITGVEASYVYTGNAIEPTVVLKDGETVIAASEYTVAYSDNAQKGTATITVTDKDGGNYTIAGTTKTFIITDHVHSWTYSAEGATITATCNGAGLCPVNGKTATITLSADERMEYNGESKPVSVIQTPTDTFVNVEVSYKDANGTALTGAPVDVGTYTASITMGEGTTKVTAAVEFTITPQDLSALLGWGISGMLNGATVTLDKSSYVYTGSEIKPVPTITWNNMTLAEGKDYTLKYCYDRINAGEKVGLLQITGIGNFGANTNCYNYSFTIEKAPYTPAATEASFTQNYTKESFTVNLYDVIKLPNDSGGHDFIVPEGSGATITWNEENGYVLTATITNGEIGQEFFFPVTVETNNYKDYVFTIKLTLAEKKDQTISWNEAALDEISWTYGDEPVDLSDYLIDGEGSGKVTYTVESATEGFTIFGDATVDGSVITFVHAGGISITAHKAADEEYNEATSKVLWRFIEPIDLDSTLTFAPVTEAGTMISDVEVTSVIEDKDGNPLSGSVEWYEWSEEEDDWTIIETPEAYEVQEGVEYKYKYVPQDTNYRDLFGWVILWSSHVWTYTVDENTITATCTKHEDCVVIMKLRIVDTLVYDGTEQRISMDNSNPDLLDMPVVFYEMKNGTEWKAMDEVPVNAGTYRAGFTLGDATAYLEYTVEKAPMDTEGMVIRFSSSVTYDEGKPVSVVEEIALNGVQKIYYSTSTNNRTWSDWTETMPTMSQPGYLYVKAKVVVDDNYEEYVTAVSVVRMINSSSGGNVGGGGSYYPPYGPSYPSYPTATPVPTTAPTPVPTVAPTAVPTEAPKPTEAPVPTVTPVPGTVMVETTGNAVVDEKGEEITSIIQEPGTTNKLNIPGFTDTEGAEVAWKSTNPEVAEVDENGNVTLKAPGLAEVVVTVGEGEDAKTETIVVYVEEPRTYVNPLEEAFKDVRLGTSWGDIPLVRYQAVGETIDINFWGVKNWEKDNYDYVWQTSDNSVATVDSKGRITALKPGVVSLTLGLKNKKNGNLLNVQSVEVVIPENTEEKILLGTSRDNTFDAIELKLNERIDINFYGVKNWKKDEYEYHWSSSEPSVVFVDSVGKLTPVSPGKAEVFLVLVEKKTGAPRHVIPVTVTVPEKAKAE